MAIKFQYLKSIFPGVILALIFCLFSQGINNVLAIEIFGAIRMFCSATGSASGNELSSGELNRYFEY